MRIKRNRHIPFKNVFIIKPGEQYDNITLRLIAVDTLEEAKNVISYLQTDLVSFLVLRSSFCLNINSNIMSHIPVVNFKESWDNENVYKYFNISKEEIELINNTLANVTKQGVCLNEKI